MGGTVKNKFVSILVLVLWQFWIFGRKLLA